MQGKCCLQEQRHCNALKVLDYSLQLMMKLVTDMCIPWQALLMQITPCVCLQQKRPKQHCSALQSVKPIQEWTRVVLELVELVVCVKLYVLCNIWS